LSSPSAALASINDSAAHADDDAPLDGASDSLKDRLLPSLFQVPTPRTRTREDPPVAHRLQ